jgi:hypothetical protein
LCFLAGRSSKFPQLFAVTQSCRGNYLINLRVSFPLFTCSYKAFGCFQFQISGYCILVVKVFRFLLFIVIIVSGLCTSMYLSFNWVCWVRGNFSGELGPVYIPCVCLRCAERRAGTSIFGHIGGVDGGTVRIFLSLWLCSGGYGTVEIVKGLVRVFLCFLQFAVSSRGGWISVVGILRYILLLVFL